MLDERWDTVQEAYLDHCVEKHGIPILALLYTPTRRRLEAGPRSGPRAAKRQAGYQARGYPDRRPLSPSEEAARTLGGRTARTGPRGGCSYRRREHKNKPAEVRF